MNRFLLSISALSLIFCACDKNKEMVRYTELYHIEGNDTISAIYIPNSFTPQGDGQNDIFQITCLGIINVGYELTIYNTNGELFFQTECLSCYWDGSHKGLKSKNGTYDFRIKAKDSTFHNFEFAGKVELVK